MSRILCLSSLQRLQTLLQVNLIFLAYCNDCWMMLCRTKCNSSSHVLPWICSLRNCPALLDRRRRRRCIRLNIALYFVVPIWISRKMKKGKGKEIYFVVWKSHWNLYLLRMIVGISAINVITAVIERCAITSALLTTTSNSTQNGKKTSKVIARIYWSRSIK